MLNRWSIALLTFLAVAGVAGRGRAQIALSVDAPQANAVVGNRVNVSVVAMGAFTRLEFAIGDIKAELPKTSAVSYQTSLDLTSQASGPKTLVVTAFDASANPTSTSVQVNLDRPPTVTILEPLPSTVIRTGFVHVRATCSDDGPTPCVLRGASGSTLDENRPLADSAEPVEIQINADDSAGQTAAARVSVYVTSSKQLREVLTIDTGEVLDYDGTRALGMANQKRASVWTSGTQSSTAYDRADATDNLIGGELYPGGALLLTDVDRSAGVGLPGAWTWNGSQTVLEGVYGGVAGNWLGLTRWMSADGVSGTAPSVALRNVMSGMQTSTPAVVGLGFYTNFAVANNGDAVWTHDSLQLIWLRGGVSTNFRVPGGAWRSASVDEQHATATWSGGASSSTYLFTEQERVTLCELMLPSHSLKCPQAVLVGGWAAYSALTDDTTNAHRYRRSPAGGVQELFGIPNVLTITAMSPDGQQVIASSFNARVLSNGTDPATSIPFLGSTRYVNGKWYLLIGRSVFELVPEGGVDPAQPIADAGTLDAAVSAGTDAGGPDAATPTGDATLDAASNVADARPPDASTLDSGAARTPSRDEGCATRQGSRLDGGLWLLALALLLRRPRDRARAAAQARALRPFP